MNPRYAYSLLLFGAVLVILNPAAAALVQSGAAFAPEPPLVPGMQQHVAASYVVIPSGSDTVASGHSFQMQTDLSGAQWTIQVTVDGRNAAAQTATGTVAFVNGALLSYSTDHDVGLSVTIDGTVPQDAAGQIAVLQIVELNNAGTGIPGSLITITLPVAGSSPAVAATSVPVPVSESPESRLPAETRTPGFALPAALAALSLAATGVRAWRRER